MGASQVWSIRLGGRRWELGRSGTLLISRTAEQGVLGLASLLLAWRLGVRDFAPVSALLVFNSFAVVTADFGLGTDLMGRPMGDFAMGAVTNVRIWNSAFGLLITFTGIGLGGSWTVLLIGAGFVWISASEAFIRKSSLIKLGRPIVAARGEILGSVLLAFGVTGAFATPTYAVAVVAAGLTGKHLSEALLCRGWTDVFSTTGQGRWNPAVWFSLLLNFAIANVDFLIVAAVISGDAFSIYSLGFRIASTLVALVSYVVNRVAVVDFGEAHRGGTLGESYRHRRLQMYLFGVLAGLLSVIVVIPVSGLLGEDWKGLVGVVAVLSLATPFRMCGGLGVVAAIAVGKARQVTRWEACRLVLATAVLALSGLFGLRYFATAASVVAIATTVSYDQMTLDLAGESRRSWILGSGLMISLMAVIAGLRLSFGI